MSIIVCHLTSVHPIEDIRIFHKQCSSLAMNGFDVSLIACGDKEFVELRNGITCISLYVPIKNRIQRFFKRSKAVYKKALEVDANIYHFHDPELLPIGLKLKRKGKKVIFDSHEDVFVNILDKHYIPNSIKKEVQFLFNKYLKYVIPKLDAVISVTPHIVEKFFRLNPNTFQITNYPITVNSINEVISEKFDTPTIFFAGGVTPLFNHENIIMALDYIDFEITYLIAGPSSDSYLSKLKTLKSWNKVEYLGLIPHCEVHSLYSKSHIGIAIANYSENGGGKLGTLGNNKIFEIMRQGIPIICTDFILWKEIVEVNKAGICVNPSDVKAIANAIIKIICDLNLAKEMGENGKKIVSRQYNWKTQESELINIYKNKL